MIDEKAGYEQLKKDSQNHGNLDQTSLARLIIMLGVLRKLFSELA